MSEIIATAKQITEEDKKELKRIIDENFSELLSEEERAQKLEWLLSRPGANETYIRYLNTKLTKVGVKCDYGNGTTAKFYLITPFGEEFDDD